MSSFAFADAKSACVNHGSNKIKPYDIGEGKTLPNAIQKPFVRYKKTSRTIQRGLSVFSDSQLGNCLACHQVEKLLEEAKSGNSAKLEKYSSQGNIGGSLDGVGKKYNEGEIRMILVDPKLAFSGKDVTMPSYYKLDGLKDVVPECEGRTILNEKQIEDLIDYLSTLK